ncbi:MAG: esterase/lipase [Microbacteriaceae bacterium]|nr:esterase/lipase [Microbacteriaceae bacterium]
MPTVPEATYRVVDATVHGRDGDIPVREYLPHDEIAGAPLLWMHGGGFAFGGLDMKESDAPARFLAATGRRVRAVDYRLAPKIGPWSKPDLRSKPNRFPAALHDVVDAAHDLASVTGRRISIGGASAGANLAAGAAMMLRDEAPLDLVTLVLAYGAFHGTLPDDPEIEGQLHGLAARIMFNQKMITRICLNYVGDPALMVPGYALPGGGDVHGLPPTLLLNAQNDRLSISGEAFARELTTAGVTVHDEIVPGAGHGFLNSPRKRDFTERMTMVDTWLRQQDARVAAE